MVFPVVMYGCESWTVKKAEHGRIDASELWCWRRLLRVPWTARRSNQSILKELSPGCSLEGLMLKLKLQYFGHLMRRTDSFEKTLMLKRLRAREEGDDRGGDGWMASPTRWTWVWADSESWWWTGRPVCCSSWGCQELDMTELNWRGIKKLLLFSCSVLSDPLQPYGLQHTRHHQGLTLNGLTMRQGDLEPHPGPHTCWWRCKD